MKKSLMIALGLVVGMAFVGGNNAYAGSCGSTAVCNFDLTVANVSNIGPIDVRVTWDNSGSTTKFSVQWISGGPGTPGFIEKFGFNTAATVTSVTYNGNDVTSLWTGLNTGPGNEDGFGSFLSTENGGPTSAGSREGISAPIVFTLSTKITSIAPTSANTEFAVHIGGYPTGCSAFVGEGGSTVSQSPDANCGSTSTPEPITLLLLGPGLLFVGIAGRKISGLKQKDS
jgi:hypothetical protein